MISKLTRLTDEELAELAFYAGESTSHSDPNYLLSFESLATGSSVLSIVIELQERRKADSEPVATLDVQSGRPDGHKFSLAYSSVAHKLPDDVYFLYRHAQPAPVVQEVDADDNFYSWFGREWQENYQHNQYTTAAKQMLGVMAESAWKAGRRAAMLQAQSVCTCPSGDGSLRWPCPVHTGNSPVIPEGYVMVPKEPTKEILDEFDSIIDYGAEDSEDAWRRLLAASQHDTPALNSLQSVDSVAGKWIPVSERMPEDRISVILWDAEIGEVTSGHYSHKTHTFYHCGDAIQNEITHWMPLPAAPQEVPDGQR